MPSRRIEDRSGIPCPECGNSRNRVTDTRHSHGGYVTRRRRECLDCRFRFTTWEGTVETLAAMDEVPEGQIRWARGRLAQVRRALSDEIARLDRLLSKE